MSSFEIPLGPDGKPLHGMRRYPSSIPSEDIIQPTDVPLVPSWSPAVQESLQFEPTSPQVKMEKGTTNDTSLFSTLTGNNTAQNIDTLAQQLDSAAAADPVSGIPRPFVFGQANNSRADINVQYSSYQPRTPQPLHLSSLLNFDNTYIVDGNSDVFHGYWQPVQRFDGPWPAPVASAAAQTDFIYPECESLPDGHNDASSTNEVPTAAPTDASAASAGLEHSTPASRPMFVFRANNNTIPATPTRVLAIRPLRPRPLGASTAAATTTSTAHSSNNLVPAGTREAARYRLTNAGTSHRELVLASTSHEPLPIPSPAREVVDMRVLLDAMQHYPMLGREVATDGFGDDDDDDEDDEDEEEDAEVVHAAAALVKVADEAQRIAAATWLVAAANEGRESTVSASEEEEEEEADADDDDDDDYDDDGDDEDDDGVEEED